MAIVTNSRHISTLAAITSGLEAVSTMCTQADMFEQLARRHPAPISLHSEVTGLKELHLLDWCASPKHGRLISIATAKAPQLGKLHCMFTLAEMCKTAQCCKKLFVSCIFAAQGLVLRFYKACV